MPGQLTPGTPEYNAYFEKKAAAEQEKRDADQREQRRSEGQAAVDKKNSWRKKLITWFDGAKDGDTITTDMADDDYLVIEKTIDRNGKKIQSKQLVQVGGRGDGLNRTVIEYRDGRVYQGPNTNQAIDPSAGFAQAPETDADSIGAQLGQAMEDGRAKVGAGGTAIVTPQSDNQPAVEPTQDKAAPAIDETPDYGGDSRAVGIAIGRIHAAQQNVANSTNTRTTQATRQEITGAIENAEKHGVKAEYTPRVGDGSESWLLTTPAGNQYRVYLSPAGRGHWLALGKVTPAPEERAYTKGQAEVLARRMTNQGPPREAYPHPTQDGMWAIRVPGEEQPADVRDSQIANDQSPDVDFEAMFDEVLAEETPAAPSTVSLPQAVSSAISGQMGKQKRRMMRLNTEAKADNLDLQGKLEAQTKAKAAEASLTAMRTKVFAAEDAAAKAIAEKDLSAFAEFEMLFPDAHAEIAKQLGVSAAPPTPKQKEMKARAKKPVTPQVATPAWQPPTLAEARNDLAEMKSRASGPVVDARLLDHIKQLEAMVKELEAEADPKVSAGEAAGKDQGPHYASGGCRLQSRKAARIAVLLPKY